VNGTPQFSAGAIRCLVNALPRLERNVILLRYGFDGPELPPAAVAYALLVSEEAIEAAEEQALEILRVQLDRSVTERRLAA